MDEAYIGEIRMIAFGFVPRGWLLCDGSLLSIANNTALFSLIGTTYGGNGQTTFALPDLRGRVPVGTGQGNGLMGVLLGQNGGVENVTLTTENLPAHAHPVAIPATATTATSPAPGNLLTLGQAQTSVGGESVNLYATADATTNLKPFPSGPTGAGAPVPLRSPYLGINFIICTDGIFPSRP